MRIVCFHLFNDYSGSPKVLRTVIEGLLEKGYSVDLVTSRGGVLDELKGKENLRLRQYNYKFSRNVLIRLLRYAWVQAMVFFIALSYLPKKKTAIYINTILPMGAAIGGRLACKRVIYHYHENAKAKSTAYRILAKIMQLIASDIICVSQYQRSFLKRKKRVHVIPNAVCKKFAEKITPDCEKAFSEKRVLMLGSLKGYKGTEEFIEIAGRLGEFSFELVINDNKENIDRYLQVKNIIPPANLAIHPRQENVATFYNRASLVMNLSNKNLFIETFGLTALEAMTAGLPVIVPTVGGIAEMVTDGVNGYKIDVQNIEKIEDTIKHILSDAELYRELSSNAIAYSKKYSESSFIGSICQTIHTPHEIIEYQQITPPNCKIV